VLADVGLDRSLILYNSSLSVVCRFDLEIFSTIRINREPMDIHIASSYLNLSFL
jgi:hypothetical protein